MQMASETKPKKRTCCDTIRFYFTAFFILLATFSTFTFIFLVPFVIDPGFATLYAEFNPDPVVCITVDSASKFGLRNCSWSSCREGCTRDVFRCTQIYVSYFKDTEGIYEGTNYTDPEDMKGIKWQYEYAKIFPNVKGCGYPPEVNCTIFNKMYRSNGTTFPCYYSTLMPNLTIIDLNLEETKQTLIYAIVLPWGSFVSSVLYLLITYVGCSKAAPSSIGEGREATSGKTSKEVSNYSLRSLGKSINQGVNRLMGDTDDKGCSKVAPLDTDIPLPSLGLNPLLTATHLRNTSRRNTLPPLEYLPQFPRPTSSKSEPNLNL